MLLILLIRPGGDVLKGWQVGGPAMGTGLTSQQPHMDPQEEREQLTKRDQRVQKE